MSNETDDTVNSVDMDDLDAFSKNFFSKEPKATLLKEPEEVLNEDDEVAEIEDDALAPKEDDTESEESDEDLEEEEEEEEVKPRPNRMSAKERIRELVTKTREAERRETALLKRIEALETPKEEKAKPEPTSRETSSAESVDPDTLGKDGEPLYPLGEYDPLYIRDLTRLAIKQEREVVRAEEAKAAQAKSLQAAQSELTDKWVANVNEVEKTIPDLREAIDELTETFQDVESDYGEYLAATIMSCELGPQIMYYLSQNIGEAQKIVASGPAAATLAIGRLEARLQTTYGKEEKRETKRVSNAPKPPERAARGSGGKFNTPPDTDDLDAFEKEFFKKK